ncbi:acylneuraminate cytidylyltransferase family protein [Plesiomonas shigelloides]|uniref:acylneuraminate cytidylyltransferase family protein n=1 Tax=Plesiomonas shigelloides TaxID=703 RepID=UPI000D573DF8|nr:acylneuraminate cytidylyltransferase family protein [Plesiomonas shigelloides]PVU65574.1 acylneuraminate cytidylyltransferase family protein [Plesiomonas shigelloides]
MNIALITARGGSKGVPRKNIISINGSPLISYTINAARKSKCIDAVYVSTDDNEIADISREHGALIINRPECLAGDFISSDEVVLHAIQCLYADGIYLDNIFLLQPTSPLRNENHIEEAYCIFNEGDVDCVVSVYETEDCPAKAFKFNSDGSISGLYSDDAPYLSRQTFPKSCYANGAIYIFKSDLFLDKNEIPRNRIKPYVMPYEISIDIDTWDDVERVKERLSALSDGDKK